MPDPSWVLRQPCAVTLDGGRHPKRHWTPSFRQPKSCLHCLVSLYCLPCLHPQFPYIWEGVKCSSNHPGALKILYNMHTRRMWWRQLPKGRCSSRSTSSCRDVKTVGKKWNSHSSTDKRDVARERWGFVAVVDSPSVDSMFLQENRGTIFTSAVCYMFV